MISRFFKRKKPKAPEPKKAAPVKPKIQSSHLESSPKRKLLTAEGWKRMMMRKSYKGKK